MTNKEAMTLKPGDKVTPSKAGIHHMKCNEGVIAEVKRIEKFIFSLDQATWVIYLTTKILYAGNNYESDSFDCEFLDKVNRWSVRHVSK